VTRVRIRLRRGLRFRRLIRYLHIVKHSDILSPASFACTITSRFMTIDHTAPRWDFWKVDSKHAMLVCFLQ
jgi:hypothetical protein